MKLRYAVHIELAKTSGTHQNIDEVARILASGLKAKLDQVTVGGSVYAVERWEVHLWDREDK